MRCFVSESQRGDRAPGENSTLEERREVEESVRVEEVVEMELSRRSTLRRREVVVFIACSELRHK